MSCNRRIAGLGLIAALAGLALATSTSAAPYKPYSVVFTAGADANGLTVTALITNPATNQQQIGSANLTPPPGYTLSTTGGSVSSPGTFSVSNNAFQWRNLNLAPGQSATATIDVASSPCSAGSWNVIAKQANDFSGLPGNDLGPQINSNVVTSLCGAPCKKNSACSGTDAGNTNGNAQVVTGKGKLTGQLVESANANDNSNFAPLACAGYTSSDPNTYSLLAPADRDKVATITFKSGSSVDLPTQQICFEAPYAFTGGTNVAPVGSPPDYVGLLPDCTPSGTGPCHNRSQDTETQQGNVFNIVLVADIPAAAGDPRMG